jgi:coenzyme F420-dependent glucose-6-phosphate dehydrogenase
MRFGMTLSSEEHQPRRLVELARMAEDHGFDFVSISDHYHPWISEQGHSPFVWSVLGAIANATRDIEVAVGVTCPTVRIHPAVLAQAVATTAILFEGRLVWGVGTGEDLNEHILGRRWPPAPVRLEMLEEAIGVIRRLWSEDSVTHRGTHYTVEDARIFDKPDQLPPVIVSAFGPKAGEVAARIGDGLWMTGTDGGPALDSFRAGGGRGPVYTQITICWGEDREEAIDLAHRVWPNTGVPGQLSQDLRTVEHFEQATSIVTRDTIAEAIHCGPDPEPIIESIREAVDAGADHVYLHQIGPDQEGFVDFWSSELAPVVKTAAVGRR